MARFGELRFHPRFRLAVRVAVPIVLVALVAPLIVSTPTGPRPTESPAATHVAQATASATPTATAEPWETLVLDPVVAVASLAPNHLSAAGVAIDSAFSLRSLDGSPAAALAAGLRADPPLEFRIVEGPTAVEAILEPVTPLLIGTTYRLTLEAPDGALAGSWAFRTQRPLHIVGVLPGDRATDVPVTTGIEITFDQDGTTGLPERFHIEPAVDGRFEQHGRTWSFVPRQPLATAAAYRVTIDPGVAISDSDQVLESGMSFRFETEVGRGTPEWSVAFAGPLAAVKPGEQLDLPLFANVDDSESETPVPPPDKLPVRIYRLPDLATAMAAAARLTGPDRWLKASGAGLVDTSALHQVASVDGRLVVDRAYTGVLQIPVHLDAGAYVVVIPRSGHQEQLLLQVGTLSTYAVSSQTDSVAWVNDLATVTPITGASVRAPDGAELGRTDPDGVARFRAPATTPPVAGSEDEYEWAVDPNLISISAPDGRWLVVALGSPVSYLDGGYDNFGPDALAPSNRWWLLFETDRLQYRQTDVIHAWGMVRPRDAGAVPAHVQLRLRPAYGDAAPAIERVTAEPDAQGVFAIDLAIRDLPRASYSIDLVVDGEVVAGAWIDVTEIRKPSYRLDVQVDRHGYLDGDTIEVTIQAAFFDGTTVPRTELHVESDPIGFSATVTTDATGAAHLTIPARFHAEYRAGWSWQSVEVAPVRPEEGEITGRTGVVVFPSTAWLTPSARLDGTTLVVEGRVSRVDFRRVDDSWAAEDWAWPSEDAIVGAPLAGRPVSATVTQQREVRQESDQYYDYLEKRVVTTYEYRIVSTKVGTYQATSAPDGTFRIQLSVPSASTDYDVTVTSSDPAGRSLRDYASAARLVNPRQAQAPSYLLPSGCGYSPPLQVGLDADATVTMRNGDGSVATDGRFLFLVANRGLRDVVPNAAATYSRQLGVGDLPGFTIRAVQVTAHGYIAADARVEVDVASLAIDVRLQPDRQRYGPGDRVSVRITTLGPDGQPIPADVIVQGVDEKLFAIGAAADIDVLRQLHRATGAGILQSFASHRIPVRFDEGGCGDEGGGRESFGDVVTFQLVRTGADGEATVSFDLLDDLTSWHVTALALSGGIRAGNSSVLIPVSLPFFVETVLAPEYLVGDEPVLRLRTYGDALADGDRVRFSVSAPSLGINGSMVEGVAFDAVRFDLPALSAGDHRISVEARNLASGQTDIVIRTIHVIPSRLAGLVTHYADLVPGFAPEGGAGLTTYTIVDAGRGALLTELLSMAATRSARFDRTAAAEIARRILIDEFGFSDSTLEPTGFDASRYEQYGIAVLPYASRDPELTALAALVLPELINADSARSYLRGDEDSEVATSESRVVALAGLAGLGDDVLEELVAIDATKLSIRESLWLAIGLAAVGDETRARALERALLAAYGQRFGPWVRLNVGTSIDDTVDAARLLLLLSARLGEPFARDVERYLLDNPTSERAIALEQLAYVQASLARLPRGAGRVAWTVGGERHELELERGNGLTLVLTAAQRATFALESLHGALAVVTSWTGTAADVPSGGPLQITRTVTPASNAPEDRLVRVHISLRFDPLAPVQCWQMTDLAPSGLAPVAGSFGWRDDDVARNVGRPYEMDGQRVSWCASPRDRTHEYEYVARVVSPGTYRWEPAIIQSVDAPEVGAATGSFIFTIR